MAQYHDKAAKLKPLVEAANFSPEQLSLILKMMRGCTMLRQGSVINSFLECMLPANMELRQGAEIAGKYGTYRPVFVAVRGSETLEPVHITQDKQED